MKPIVLTLGLLLSFAAQLWAQFPIRYQVNLDQIHHHELQIEVEFESVGLESLALHMSNASPGRYAEHNFAKNVYNLMATDDSGNPLTIYQVGPSSWEVVGHKGYVKVHYTLYGNHADGTYTGIDRKKVHMNMPATFMFAKDMEQWPIEVAFDLSDHPDWSVATQLKQEGESRFSAPNYAYFFDSPTMIGDISFRRWEVPEGGSSQIIEIAMMHEGTDQELDNYVEMVKQVVDEQLTVFGSLPRFDYGKYTFLCSYNPWVYGDGMEHRNSTICTSKGNLHNHAGRLIRTISHEFFHAWNVERFRPASLEPFDYTQANLSGELWFAEGFTSYYDDYVLARVGIISPEEFISGNTGMFNYVLNGPGRQLRNPIEMSYYAPFTDAASAIDEDNEDNTFISYYSYGAVLGFALDLSLRTQFDDITLDDYMSFLWESYGQNEIPYTIPDLEKSLALLTKDFGFARDFFQKYIYDHELPDFPTLFAEMGVSMQLQSADEPFLGEARLKQTSEGVQILGTVPKGRPLYEAGLNQGDVITHLNQQAIANSQGYLEVVKSLQKGQKYPITFVQMGEVVESQITPGSNPNWTLKWLPDNEISDKARQRRNKWLNISRR